MSNKINILPEYIANQIAAGEVVQRPESVVKELVENSIDANAKNIAVIVHQAGKSLLHIVDDGDGISKDDLKLAVKRHCTSKIFTQEDLDRILTYGFRGEALASIAAVSMLEIRSKTSISELGNKLLSEPMKEVTIEPFVMEKGTQIFVKNLFYNTPARRKFLRADITEFRYISDTMMRFALSNPHIRFTFYDEDNLVFDLQPSSLENRIQVLLGNKFSDGMFELDYSNEYIKISGFLADPALARNYKTHQFLFLNKRAINSKSIAHSIHSVYEPLLDKNQYPVYIVNMEIDASLVDVNVHPQKNEVKFENEKTIYNFMLDAVSSTLKKYYGIPEYLQEQIVAKQPFEKKDDFLVNKSTGEIISPFDYSRKDSDRLFSNKKDFFDKSVSNPISSRTAFDLIFGNENINQNSQFLSDFQFNELSAPDNISKTMLFNDYFIFSIDMTLYIMNLKNTYRRVLYAKILNSLLNNGNSSQNLMFPININMNLSELNRVKELEDDLTALGFGLTIESSNVIINSVPSDISSGSEGTVLESFISEYYTKTALKELNKKEKIAYSYVAASVLKGKLPKNINEAKDLLNNLKFCKEPHTCPFGRKTIIKIEQTKLELLF